MENQRRGPMAGPGARMSGEKVEKKTWGKLLRYCKKYGIFILIAILCAMGGTVLTLTGPDKLSELTDIVTEGIVPDTEELTEIASAVGDNVSQNTETVSAAITEQVSENTQTVIGAVAQNMAGVQNAAGAGAAAVPVPIEVNGVELPVEDQAALMELVSGLDMEDAQAVQTAMGQFPDSVTDAIYTEIEVNGSLITGADQREILSLAGEMDMEADAEDGVSMDALEEFPDSFQEAIFTDLEYDGTVITGADQRAMLDILSGMDSEDSEGMLDALDELPDSIADRIRPHIDLEEIGKIGMFLVTIYVLGACLSALQGWIMASVTQKLSRQLRTDISEKINRLPMSYYHHHSTGDILSRVTNDVDLIGTSMNMSVGTLVSAITLFIGSLIMMLKTNLLLTATGVIATLIGFVLMLLIMTRSQKYFTRQQRCLGSLNGQVEEIYSGHTVVKAYSGEEAANREFDALNEQLRTSGFRAQAMSGLMMPIMSFIGNFGYVAVCVVGAALAMDGRITFGVIVSFMMYIRFFTQPLSQIAQATQQMQSAGAAAGRVFEFMDAEEMEDESEKTGTLGNVSGEVAFSHVKFGYEPDKTIIHDFSAKAKPGQKIAIVGPTGAGKTTIVNLLMRFYEIDSGKICIDGVDTASLKRSEVHSQFCMVLQDTWLFEGTVRENLIYCSENVSEDKMKAACRAVGLDHFIRTLPKGYDTVLNDQVSLSQGQKQQITIARAMIADKPILILDEATSSIDTRTEQQIQDAMDKLMEGRTSFVIAHRLSTIRNADLILVLKDGDVIESGNHEELLAQGGFYADLYNSQFEPAQAVPCL